MQTKKHHFEAVSLLTPKQGKLSVSIIPALGQPHWLVPTALILGVYDTPEWVWNYQWRHPQGTQEVPVYPLVSRDIGVDKVIILEGNTDAHRLALQTRGNIEALEVKISDVKDTELDEEEWQIIQNSLPYQGASYNIKNIVYQTVMLAGEVYIVPNLDNIMHYLVDLDS